MGNVQKHISIAFLGNFDRFTGALGRDLQIDIIHRFEFRLEVVQKPGVVETCCRCNEKFCLFTSYDCWRCSYSGSRGRAVALSYILQ